MDAAYNAALQGFILFNSLLVTASWYVSLSASTSNKYCPSIVKKTLVTDVSLFVV